MRGRYLGRSFIPAPYCKPPTENGTKDSQSYPVDSSDLDLSAASEDAPAAWASSFLLGVDSFYSLLKNNRDHPGDEKTIDDLLFVRGMDIAIDEPEVDDLFDRFVENAKRVADQFCKTLLVASTNLRHFTNKYVSWGKTCHGAASRVSRWHSAKDLQK